MAGFALKDGESLRRSRALLDPDAIKMEALSKTVAETLRYTLEFLPYLDPKP